MFGSCAIYTAYLSQKIRAELPTFEKQGDAETHEKSKETPKNTKLAYNSKAK